MNGEHADIYEGITEVKIGQAETNAKLSGLADRVDRHISKDEKWKEGMDSQFTALSNAYVEMSGQQTGERELSGKVKATIYGIALIVATACASLIGKLLG